MTIYVVKTFRGYWATASEEEAELMADKLYDELKSDCDAGRIRQNHLWVRIVFYRAKDLCGSPFVFSGCCWANKM